MSKASKSTTQAKQSIKSKQPPSDPLKNSKAPDESKPKISSISRKNSRRKSDQIPPIDLNPKISSPDLSSNSQNNQKKLQILSFFQKAPEKIQGKSKRTFSSLSDKIVIKTKPSHRFLSFFDSVPQEIHKKFSIDFQAFRSSLLKSKFEEDQEKFVEELHNEIGNQKKPLGKISNNDQTDKEKEFTRRRILEAEKKKMLIEQKIREIDKEIKGIESSVSQRILQETQSQNEKIIRMIENQTKEQAGLSAVELVKKMNKFKHEQDLKKQRQREELDSELAAKLGSEKKKNEESREKLTELKRLKILEKIAKINQRQQERKLKEDTSNSVIKLSNNHYQQALSSIERKVEKNFENPQLERKKKDLETRRNLYKPLDGKEIKTHAKKYEEIKKLKEQESRIKSYKETEDKRLNNKKYESIFLRKVLETDGELRNRDEKSKESRKKLVEKQQKYQSIIKDLFKPKIDVEKRKEIEERINVLHKENTSFSIKNTSFSKKDNSSFIKNSKFVEIDPIGEALENSGDFKEEALLIEMKPKSDFTGQKSRRLLKLNYELPWKTIKQQNLLSVHKDVEVFNNEFMKTEIEAHKNSKRYDNYLKDIRVQRKELEAKGVIKKNSGWDKFINDENLDSHAKYLSVITTANNIENKAKLKEELGRKGNKNDLEVQNEINDLYLESIKAKLALLNLAPKSK